MDVANQPMGSLYSQKDLRPDYDLIPPLRRVEVPTLVMHGEHDFIPVELAELAAAAVPGAHLEVLSGLGHFACLEAPRLVADLVTRFVRDG